MGCQKEEEQGEKEEENGEERQANSIIAEYNCILCYSMNTCIICTSLISVRYFDKFKLSKLTQDTKNGDYLNLSKMPCEQLKLNQSSTRFPASHQKLQPCGQSICCSFTSSSLTFHVSSPALMSANQMVTSL